MKPIFLKQLPFSVVHSEDKKTINKEATQESVVDNVLSSFSNWMKDDADSEEIEGDDDYEEGDDDEEDEEDSLEGDLEKSEENTKNEPHDLNTLHNLPPGIKVTPYNLEIDESLNGTANASTEDKSGNAHSTSTPPLSTINKQEVFVGTVKDTPENVKPPPTENIEKDITKEAIGSEEPKLLNAETYIKGLINSEDKIESVANPSSVEEEQFLKEVTIPNPLDLESQGEQLSEDFKTTNPLDATKPEDLSADKLNTITSENAEENKNEDSNLPATSYDSSTDTLQKVMEEPFISSPETVPVTSSPQDVPVTLPQVVPVTLTSQVVPVTPPQGAVPVTSPPSAVPVISPTDAIPPSLPDSLPPSSPPEINTVLGSSDPDSFIQNPATTEEGSVPEKYPHNYFYPPQNVISEDDKKTENKIPDEETNGSLNDNTVNDRLMEDSQVNVEGDVHSNGGTSDNVIGQSEDSVLSKDILDSAEIEEVTESNLGQFIIDDEEINNQKENEEDRIISHEETNENIQEEPQSDDTKSIDVPSEEPAVVPAADGGIWSGLFSFFGSSDESAVPSVTEQEAVVENEVEENVWTSQDHTESHCETTPEESCNTSQQDTIVEEHGIFDHIGLKFNSDFFLLLITTAGSVIIFLFVYMALDRNKREAPLVSRINKLEKELLITLKENELLQETGTGSRKGSAVHGNQTLPNELVEQLTQRLAEAQFAQQALEQKVADLETQLQAKASLEEQVDSLEKELETSTEVGMELNRIISEMLDPTNGSDWLKENVEQLQRQLLEQKDTINSISETLQKKEAENRTLRGDLERSKNGTADLQREVNEMMDKVLRIEGEKDKQQNGLQNEVTIYQQKYNEAVSKLEVLNNDIQVCITS